MAKGQKKAPEGAEKALPEVTLHGVKYRLRMSLWASQQLEDRYGDLKGALKAFRSERKISMVKYMFEIMANAGRKAEKRPMDVSGDVLDDCTLADLDAVARAMNAAMDESLHAETVGGNESDDEPQDALAAEYDEKNV